MAPGGRRDERGGMAKGGVVDMANGGEYDAGTVSGFSVAGLVAVAGRKDETGRLTTLMRELGRRTKA